MFANESFPVTHCHQTDPLRIAIRISEPRADPRGSHAEPGCNRPAGPQRSESVRRLQKLMDRSASRRKAWWKAGASAAKRLQFPRPLQKIAKAFHASTPTAERGAARRPMPCEFRSHEYAE